MLRFLLPKRSTYIIILIVLVAGNTGVANFRRPDAPVEEKEGSLYDQLQLSNMGLSKDVFQKAIQGIMNLGKKECVKRPEIISIADFSQSSKAKRLYIIDLVKRTVLFNTYVSHGRNSGEEYAQSFANKRQSFKSSLGLYLTGDVYQGAHGLSMRLKGVEKGINHAAEERGIVMHGADYVSERFIEATGRLGRSQGCPAIPEKEVVPIINTIKDGSCLFIFYPDSEYFRRSDFYR
jgi:hypothetical protein